MLRYKTKSVNHSEAIRSIGPIIPWLEKDLLVFNPVPIGRMDRKGNASRYIIRFEEKEHKNIFMNAIRTGKSMGTL